MTDWTKVLTSPLGLVGYALSLAFGFLAKVKRSKEGLWLTPVVTCLAITALFGGLLIAYIQVPRSPLQSRQAFQPETKKQSNSQVQQTSTGPGSPKIQGVQADVTFSVDQSTGKLENSTPDKSKQE
jgi:hypothetical protein